VTADKAPSITVARILRPHGRRGEVAAEILTSFPERLTRLASVELCSDAQPARSVRIRSCWLNPSRGGQAIFHFEGSDSISDAEKLAGLEVRIPLADRLPLPPGSYYITDLIGCEVREAGGAALGRVRDVQLTAGTPLLVLDSPRGELLVPLAHEICTRIDLAARLIEVALPPGLLDLNR
jgi:16S rRNA processing protein RimM